MRPPPEGPLGGVGASGCWFDGGVRPSSRDGAVVTVLREVDRRRVELLDELSFFPELSTRRYLPFRVEAGSMNGFSASSAWNGSMNSCQMRAG